MPSIVQLTYIVAVDTYRHFVQAAEKCFVTQPTLSMQIKKLEEELDVVIFDRTKQPVVPTDIGKKIIAQARKVLAEYNRLEALIEEEKGIVSGELTIGIIPTLSPYLLPRFVGKFSRQYPELKLKILDLQSEEIINHLSKDRIDVGILVTPLDEAGIEEKPLFYEKILVYANQSHPLLSKKTISTADISLPDIWLLTEGHCFRSQMLNLCSHQEEALKDSNLHYESGSIETLCKLVDKEGGFTLIPELAAGELPARRRKQIREFGLIPPLREVSLVYSRRFAKENQIRLLGKAIQDSVPQPMTDSRRGQVVNWR